MKRVFKRTELKKYQVQKYFDTMLSSKEFYIYNNNQLIFHSLNPINVNKFIGKKIIKIIKTDDNSGVIFYMNTGEIYIFHYEQSNIKIYNNLNVLLNKTITLADVYIFKDNTKHGSCGFYRLMTKSGYCVFYICIHNNELTFDGECYEVHLHKFDNVKKEDINNII